MELFLSYPIIMFFSIKCLFLLYLSVHLYMCSKVEFAKKKKIYMKLIYLIIFLDE